MTGTSLEKLQDLAGVTFFDYQAEALAKAAAQPAPQRRCLYYRTGAGKSITALAMVRQWGYDVALVVAPPSTHRAWETAALRFGIRLLCMSHAKFRMKDTKLSRDIPVIADEFHLFGGHSGAGWKKLEGLARGLKAPLILASATPNYNDADRVYCIQRILDPGSCKGGFLEFLYQNCRTEQNPFAMMPDVVGFLRHADAAEYLADLPNVDYLPDDLVYTIQDISVPAPATPEMDDYGYDSRKHRIIASLMEERHTRTFHWAVDEDGLLRPAVLNTLTPLITGADGLVLIYANHSTIVQAAMASLTRRGRVGLVTGATSKAAKDHLIQEFQKKNLDLLIGTASLATGTDGLDKVCDTLIILDDTDDDALRRQLIGRIMPRGADADASKKQVYRLLQ